jgi:hypothetical protein
VAIFEEGRFWGMFGPGYKLDYWFTGSFFTLFRIPPLWRKSSAIFFLSTEVLVTLED